MKKKVIYLIFVVIVVVLGIVGVLLFKSGKDKEDKSFESIIHVKLNDYEIEAITGSFCYNEGCIDKVDPLEFEYTNYFSVATGDNVEILDLDNEIKGVVLYNLATGEEEDVDLQIDDKTITIPEIYGTYVVEIKSTYEGNDISYYFKIEVNVQK